MTALLAYTVADQPWIDALRGFVAVTSTILLIAAPVAAIRYRRALPHRVMSLLVVLLGADLYIGATEAQQIGHRMLVWRLPLGSAVTIGAIVYIVRMVSAVEAAEPLR